MDKIVFTKDKPKGIWNAEEFTDELKYLLHNSKLSGRMTISFDKPFCKIKEIKLNVKKEIAQRGYKTYVSITDITYFDDLQLKEPEQKYSPLRLLKTGS